MRAASPTPAPSHRFDVASRVLAAVAGGYAMAYAFAACAALWLPLARSEAVLAATLLSFVVYTVAALWVFSVRRAWLAWAGLGIGCAVLAALAVAGGWR